MDKTQNENGTGTSKNQIVHPEATSIGENPTMQGKVLDYSASYSSSSSSSSSNPLELDANEKDLVANSFNKVEQSHMPDLLSSPDVSTTTPQWSMMSDTPRGRSGTPHFSQTDFFAQEWASINASPKQSPPVQVMGRPPGYDPNRIPSSVFSTKPTSQTDQWSVASNESLFSIHMGNNSFSRDHSIMFGKSGELNRTTDEWGNSPCMVNDSKTGELNSLPTVIETAGEHRGRTPSIDEDDVFENKNGGSKQSASSGDNERKTAPTLVGATTPASVAGEGGRNSASTMSRLSNESGNSAGSFAFLVLGGEGGSPKSVSEKPDSNAEKQPQAQAATDHKKEQAEPQSPLDTPKAITGGNKWFPCFSCCPLCC